MDFYLLYELAYVTADRYIQANNVINDLIVNVKIIFCQHTLMSSVLD